MEANEDLRDQDQEQRPPILAVTMLRRGDDTLEVWRPFAPMPGEEEEYTFGVAYRAVDPRTGQSVTTLCEIPTKDADEAFDLLPGAKRQAMEAAQAALRSQVIRATPGMGINQLRKNKGKKRRRGR